MIFEGRDLEDLRKKFYDSKSVTFEISNGDVLIKFLSPTEKLLIWPVIPTNKENLNGISTK